MNPVYEKLLRCRDQIRSRTSFEPHIALVLGSGLGSYGEKMEITDTIAYKDIDGFPVSTVPGHQGRYLFGYLNGVPIAAMQGRVHYYEGYAMSDVVLPVRLMGLLGAGKLILTNACGGVNFAFRPGDLMLIKDHISTNVPSPLIGANIEELGPRFPDMSHVYSPRLQELIRASAAELHIPLKEGVYMQFSGPQYETPAEICMARTLGADAVGMSTVCEAIAAHHMGMEVCAISCITNLAAGMLDQPITHEEVGAAAAKAEKNFSELVSEIIKRMEKLGAKN